MSTKYIWGKKTKPFKGSLQKDILAKIIKYLLKINYDEKSNYFILCHGFISFS